MEKEFVPYEQALALKELGFDEPCLGYYDDDFELFLLKYFNYNSTKAVSAPLYQQAFRWFREKYEIHSYIERLISGAFIYKIDWFEEDRHNKIVWECKSYSFEESELECLKKLIEIAQKTENKLGK